MVNMDNAIVVLRTWQNNCRKEILMMALLCFASVDRGSAFCAVQRAVWLDTGLNMWEGERKSVCGRERIGDRRRQKEKERRREGEKERKKRRER